jgi:glycosyltransferase involved in cell wall biosynthesis
MQFLNTNTPIDVIVPCYNPPEGWQTQLTQKMLDIQKLNPHTNWIIVNDGSSSPLDIAPLEKAGFEKHIFLINHTINKGKGAAIRSGLTVSKSPFIVYTDIDFPYTLDSFWKVIHPILDGEQDICFGIRSKEYFEVIPSTRRRISHVMKQLNKLLFSLPHPDTQCGLKAFNVKGKEILLDTKTNRFLIDLEFLKLANRTKGLKLSPITVYLRPDIQLSEMSLKILIQEFFSLIKIWLR